MPEPLHAGALVPQHVWCPYLRAGRLLHVDTLERDGHGLAVYALQRLPDSEIRDHAHRYLLEARGVSPEKSELRSPQLVT